MTGVRSSDIIPLLNMQLVEKGGNANILGGIQRLEVPFTGIGRLFKVWGSARLSRKGERVDKMRGGPLTKSWGPSMFKVRDEKGLAKKVEKQQPENWEEN